MVKPIKPGTDNQPAGVYPENFEMSSALASSSISGFKTYSAS